LKPSVRNILANVRFLKPGVRNILASVRFLEPSVRNFSADVRFLKPNIRNILANVGNIFIEFGLKWAKFDEKGAKWVYFTGVTNQSLDSSLRLFHCSFLISHFSLFFDFPVCFFAERFAVGELFVYDFVDAAFYFGADVFG
jgi:hypothetical protein